MVSHSWESERDGLWMRENWEESNPAQHNLKSFSLFTKLNTLLHLFVFVLSYLPQSLCKHTIFWISFFCATWWKYHCWTRDILVAQGLKSSSFVPCHSSPLFPLISCHLAVLTLCLITIKHAIIFLSSSTTLYVRDSLRFGSEEFSFSVTGRLWFYMNAKNNLNDGFMPMALCP